MLLGRRAAVPAATPEPASPEPLSAAESTRLIEFALGAQGLAAADLKARFEETFPA